MLTTRGWWFLVVSLLALALGLFAGLSPLVPLGLALVLWFAGVGLLFYARARLAVRRLRVLRTLTDDRGPVDTLWAGRSFGVRAELRLDGLLGLPHVAVADRVPFAAVLLDGETEAAGPVAQGSPLTLTYRIRPPAPGRARFEGLRLRLADLQGFFYFETFVTAVVEYRVLPVLADAGGRPAARKRHNLLPPPGIHRLRRPGSGSELLDLRDYLPGDPPKTIAWKVSARRDRLMTKEFESEVPIRCTLFVDTSNSVRVGTSGQNALARLVEIAAAVSQANTGSRDLTGLCLFDDRHVRIVRPARTPRHLVQVLHLLADAAGLVPTTGKVRVGELVPLAYAFAKEVYPQLLGRDLNHVPFLLRWFGTRPAWLTRRPSLADRMHPALLGWALGYGACTLGVLLLAGVLAGLWLMSSRPSRGDLVLWALLVAAGSGVLSLATGLAFLGWQIVLPRRQRGEVRRKRLAALVSVRHGLAPGGLEALLEDDEQMALHLQRFLAEHQVPYRLPLYDWHGRYLFADPEKVDVLARALLQSVGKGHDNELFVLLADLVELSDRLEPLLRAVRVALARHHQVMIVCPWPPGLPAPEAVEEAAALSPAEAGVVPTLRRTTAERFQRAYAALRQTFARLGVPVICAAGEESVPLILDRMDRLRLIGEAAMSDPETSVPPDQHPAVRDYGLVCMGALTLTVVALVLRRPDVWALLPALLGALGLMFRWRAGPVFVLLAVVVLLCSWWIGTNPGRLFLHAVVWVGWLFGWFRGRLAPWRMVPSRELLPASDFLLALSLLAYAAGQYRLQGLTRRLFPPDSRQRGAAAMKAEEARRRSPDGVTGREVVVLLATLAVCAVAAALSWGWLREQDTELEIANTAWQGILVLWLLGGAVLVTAAGLRYLALRRMTWAEAQLYLQDVLWRETRREQRRLNRWLAWAWLRRRRREEKERS